MKLNILFVDDESNVIRGLKRMLRSLKENWDFHFAESGFEALKIMEQNNINVVVSDMRMPQMNGAELLKIIKEKYPSTIRIILSGQSNEELALKSTRSAHQFIAKPIESDELKRTIQKSFNLYQFLNDENLRRVINGIDRLPSLPKTYLELESELSKESFSLQKITDIISHDVVMSAKILQLVNSAFFGLPQNISNVSQAINFLGADVIKSLIIYVQVFKSYEGDLDIQQKFISIWNHSLRVAKVSKRIIKKLGGNSKDAESAYIAGLLHDIGKIVIISNDDFRTKIFKKMETEILTYNEAEKQIIGSTHADVGGYLLCLWGIPDTIVQAVLHHHDAINIEKGDTSVLAAVHLANVFTDDPKLDLEFIKKFELENKLPEIIGFCYN